MQVIVGNWYKIDYPDQYRGKVAEAILVDRVGDVVLRFKNGNKVLYHKSWLLEEKKEG